jgi:hypothetical protein
MKFELPQIPETEQTPVVQGLLVLVEKFIEHTQKQQEEIDFLKDDIKIRKGEKKRPKFKASKLDESTHEETEGTTEPAQDDNKKKKPRKRNNKKNCSFIETSGLSPIIFPKAHVSKAIMMLLILGNIDFQFSDCFAQKTSDLACR